MFCVIQEIKIKKVSAGEAKEIEVHETTWRDSNSGEHGSIWGWRYSDEHFERPVRKAYRISIHESYREAGKVKKRQTVICTIEYYDIVDCGGWIGDYIVGGLKRKADILGLSEENLADMIYKKFQPIVDRVEEEFHQTEEYRAKEVHSRIISEHRERVSAFKEKYDCSEYDYNHCYDVFGKLRSPEALKKIKAEYKAKKDYERQSREQSRSYYEKFFNNYGSGASSGYGKNPYNTYGENDQILLKKFYRTLSKVYHPDSNPGTDTSAEMKLLNQLKSDWGV